ncbi:MAG: DNA-formamidopyrimidine glycosylase family protein [Actinomycetales bacterium]
MPELPEVAGLVDFLRERAVGSVVAAVEVASVTVLKTFDPPPQALEGMQVTDVQRAGKWIVLDVSGIYLAIHLAKAGWLRWSDGLAPNPARPGKSPIALRVRLDGARVDKQTPGRLPGFDLTEAGTRKKLAVHIVRDPSEVERIRTLGPDPLADDFDEAAFAALLAGLNKQIKGVLRDQSTLAGVGNAYSDEILHAARLSPFAIAGKLDQAQVHQLYEAMRAVLATAVSAASGKPAAELKDTKRAGMAVHGRTGQVCPVCGDVVREVSFADSSLQYCATCQTGGKPLADRRMSRLLR